ncbi:helix-turn-helix domain-containing protein [Georgenia sp. AZ-5]|uniref:helix-turn-helix domain-containing protein n=1 Tax=Georgenia sp. AZ-5 TaxID=3367526 RepID=UPI003755265A
MTTPHEGRLQLSRNVDRRHWLIYDIDERFAERVRSSRIRAGRSQEEIVDAINETFRLGWHQTTLAKIENKQRKVKLKEAYALADTIGVRLEELIGEADLEHPEAP